METGEDTRSWIALIVDDEPDNLGVAEKLLVFRGAQVHTAKNGVEGLEVLKQVTPTFILLDLSMPQMDGWQMHQHVRAMPQFAQVRVIALTAHAMEGDRERVLAAGFDGYIAKPFRLSTFFDEIRGCLHRERSAKQTVDQLTTEENTLHGHPQHITMAYRGS